MTLPLSTENEQEAEANGCSTRRITLYIAIDITTAFRSWPCRQPMMMSTMMMMLRFERTLSMSGLDQTWEWRSGISSWRWLILQQQQKRCLWAPHLHAALMDGASNDIQNIAGKDKVWSLSRPVSIRADFHSLTADALDGRPLWLPVVSLRFRLRWLRQVVRNRKIVDRGIQASLSAGLIVPCDSVHSECVYYSFTEKGVIEMRSKRFIHIRNRWIVDCVEV